ncbi:MAG: DUF3078 domain-containing protein [Crocinitomicaceae bacterium]|nr:DUF3078 domain-containing protein [Crocinitomicaceae bacterium]
MRRTLLVFLATFCLSVNYAQVMDKEKYLRTNDLDSLDGWKIGGLVSVNGSQVSLTNWNAGGQNSISMNGLTSLYANLTKGNSHWENSLDLGYGIQRQGSKDNVRWIKTDDKIDLDSKFGRKASKMWYYSALMNFNTQFTDGYNYPNDSVRISRFMAPGYLLLAAGMDFRPHKIFSAFIAPFTMKTTFVLDQDLANAGAFGVDGIDTTGSTVIPGKMVRFEAGGYIKLIYTHEIMENIKITSKLGLFSNYLHNPQNIDVNWETLVQFKVNKFISATLSTHLIYDDDIDIAVYDDSGVLTGRGPRLQFKEVLSVGFAYKFPAKKETEKVEKVKKEDNK